MSIVYRLLAPVCELTFQSIRDDLPDITCVDCALFLKPSLLSALPISLEQLGNFSAPLLCFGGVIATTTSPSSPTSQDQTEAST